MFSRIITMKLKQNQFNVADLTKAIDEKVLPVLRKQEGFKSAVFCANPNGTEAISLTVWDSKENAESYNEKTYPQVLQSLTALLDGGPHVKSFDVISSTFNKIPTTV
jgi:heme-degrading monooxygenase HmoA